MESSTDTLAPTSADASAIALVGSLPGGATRVQIAGDRAYVGNADSLRIVSIGNPASPTLLGTFAGPVADVQIVGDLAYIASDDSLKIVDVSNPASPTLRGTFTLPVRGEGTAQAARVQVAGGLAYVVNEQTITGIPPYRGDLEIVDVADPASPALRGTYALGPAFSDLRIVGDLAYIGGEIDIGGTLRFFTDYLLVLDIADPAHPIQRGYYRGECPTVFCFPGSGALAVAGGMAYLGFDYSGGLRGIDVSNPISPTLRSTYPITVTDIEVNGTSAYVAAGSGGLRLFDLSDPLTTTLRAAFDTPGGAADLKVRGDLIYLAEGDAGLAIYRLTQRAAATIGAGGGTLASTADATTYTFPPGAFAGSANVTHTLRLMESVPPPGSLIGIGHAFEVTATDGLTGQPIEPTTPYTITIGYSDAEKGPAIESTLALYFWDGERWVREPSSAVDTATHTITATPNHFSIWAVLGETRRVYLPLAVR